MSSTTRRQVLTGSAAAGMAAVAVPMGARVARALSNWPNEKSLRVVVPFAPGGPTDLIGRMVADAVRDAFGGRIYVENRPGAGGNVAFSQVARSQPDGYTLLVCSNAVLINPHLYESAGYDPLEDFEPIAELVTASNVFFSSPRSGLTSLAGFVAAARRSPDALTYASPGIGTTPQLAGELLKLREGLRVANVVFGGSAPASQAVLAGDVQAGCVALPGARGHIRARTLTGLAVTGETRWHDMPDVPTMLDLGYGGFVLENVYMLVAPAGMPSEVVSALSACVRAELRKPARHARLETLGFDVLARGPAMLGERLAREAPMWRDIVDKAGIRPKN